MSLINERLEMIDRTMWANTCRHVEDTEKQYLQFFDMDFEFIICVNDSDSDEIYGDERIVILYIIFEFLIAVVVVIILIWKINNSKEYQSGLIYLST